MLKTILFSATIFCSISTSGQTKKSLELSLISRYDRHANYITNYAGRAYNDTMRLSGFSSGLSIQFRKPFSPSYSIYFGVGYYRLGINKIKSNLPFGFPGVRTGRSIINEDDDSTNLGYSTLKYHYNNAAFTLGISKLFLFKNKIKLDIGAEGVGYYSFSQGYKLMNGYKYSTTNAKPLEFGINATIGVFKEYDKFYIRPALILPIYQNLKGDRVFYEDKNMNIGKWFNGVGLTLRLGKYI